MKKIDGILRVLGANGFRITLIRREVLNFILKNNNPLSSLEIQKLLLRKKISANKTTIYRELEFLKSQGLIDEVHFSDKIRRYEVSIGHHHHAVCLKCGRVEHIKLEEELLKAQKIIEKKNKFKIVNHSLEFYGFCHNCQVVKK